MISGCYWDIRFPFSGLRPNKAKSLSMIVYYPSDFRLYTNYIFHPTPSLDSWWQQLTNSISNRFFVSSHFHCTPRHPIASTYAVCIVAFVTKLPLTFWFSILHRAKRLNERLSFYCHSAEPQRICQWIRKLCTPNRQCPGEGNLKIFNIS